MRKETRKALARFEEAARNCPYYDPKTGASPSQLEFNELSAAHKALVKEIKKEKEK
jgi:hypothetical protein